MEKIDDLDLLNSLRRSDRIKTIVTIKQHHKELEIAEKLKKHNSATDSLSNMDLNEQNENSSHTPETDELHKNNEVGEDFMQMTPPAKVKDRLDRFSEKENESTKSPLSSNSQTLLDSQSIHSYSPGNSLDSPKSFKKIILTKSSNENNQSISIDQPTFEFPPDYQCIDKNMYACKR